MLGFPVKQSYSPRLHGRWLEALNIDGILVPFEVSPEDLSLVLPTFPRLGLVGACVTIPHKEATLTLMHNVDDAARAIGAVNVISINDNGELIGRNTDGYGFIESLRQSLPDWKADHGPALVLGAGGAARAVVYGLASAGVPEIRVINRTRKRAERLAKELSTSIGCRMSICDWDEMENHLSDVAVLVNTTSLGMVGMPPLRLSLNHLPVTAVVVDIVYVPLMTPLLEGARQRGNHIVDGLGMLIHQARPAFREWFGVDPEVTETLRSLLIADLRV